MIFNSIFHQFKGNFSKTILYFSGSIVQAILAIVAQPIYSKYLTGAEFGIMGYYDSVKNALLPVFILSLTSVYLMKYFTQTEVENKRLLFNITFNLFLVNLGTMLISFCVVYLYFDLASVSIPLNPLIWFVLSGLVLDNIKNMLLINFRIRRKAKEFFFFSVLNAVLNFIFGILLVKYFNYGIEGRMFAPLLATLVITPFALMILRKYAIFSIDFSEFRKSLKMAFPLVLAAYAFVPIISMDFFYLEKLGNLHELGLYSVGTTIAGYVQLVFVALSLTFEPDIFKSVAEQRNFNLFKIGLAIFLPYALFISIYIACAPYLINFLTAGRFVEAEKYIGLSALNVFLMGFFAFMDKIFVALHKTKVNLLLNTLGGIVSIVLLYFLIESNGFFGALYGKICVSLLMILVSIALLIVHLQARPR